jgi:hypothetical protein
MMTWPSLVYSESTFVHKAQGNKAACLPVTVSTVLKRRKKERDKKGSLVEALEACLYENVESDRGFCAMYLFPTGTKA